MNKLILLLTFVSAICFATSQTVELGPTIGGGSGGGVSSLNSLTGALNLVEGSGITITPSGTDITISSSGSSGANTTLSNLDTPTAVNQPLNDSAGIASLDLSNRFLYDSSGNNVFDYQNATLYDNSANQPVISFGISGLKLTDTSGTIALQWDNRFLRDTSQQTVIDWGNTALQDHSQNLALDWGTDTAALRLGAGKALVMRNLQPVSWRNSTDTADLALLTADNSNRLNLGDGSGSIILVNNPSGPSAPLTYDIGLNGDEFRAIYVGAVNIPGTITAGGTTGAQTINKSTGTVNFAAAATSIDVTNSVVTTSSIVLTSVRTADTTCTVKNAVPTTGHVVITMIAACTAETSVGFVVINQ